KGKGFKYIQIPLPLNPFGVRQSLMGETPKTALAHLFPDHKGSSYCLSEPYCVLTLPGRARSPPHKNFLMHYFSCVSPLLGISVNTAPLASFVKPLRIHQWPLLTVNSQQSTLLWNIFYLKVPRRENQGYSQYTQQYSGCKQNNLLRYQEMAKENL
ncbi:hypothetical protein VF13_37305, partial [Nostoc linckia z16]